MFPFNDLEIYLQRYDFDKQYKCHNNNRNNFVTQQQGEKHNVGANDLLSILFEFDFIENQQRSKYCI